MLASALQLLSCQRALGERERRHGPALHDELGQRHGQRISACPPLLIISILSWYWQQSSLASLLGALPSSPLMQALRMRRLLLLRFGPCSSLA